MTHSSAPPHPDADEPQAAAVADTVRRWCQAWDQRDVATIAALEARAGGYGLRQAAWRDHAVVDEARYRALLGGFFARMTHYALTLTEVRASVIGGVGLAHGRYEESFQEQGGAPERLHPRFTMVLAPGPQGWHIVQYHRDIQVFGTDGAYLRHIPPAG